MCVSADCSGAALIIGVILLILVLVAASYRQVVMVCTRPGG
ncbi:hypothetical protein [Mycobacterium lepromatosis]|nr:hypothetical protein [Mycobacterium lepromatosis]